MVGHASPVDSWTKEQTDPRFLTLDHLKLASRLGISYKWGNLEGNARGLADKAGSTTILGLRAGTIFDTKRLRSALKFFLCD